ncbi:hypothetical protein [Haloarcula marina]|uniref:hypothetical protein n=1 Tax=Haloarcula marina TaxID=2961574 RepID=UPI0020B74C7A|nr:hypothetical protein [Halomicroarcula marina]
MRLATLAVVVCCLTAGCLGFGGQPADTTQDVQLSVDNAADEAYDVRVSVVPGDVTNVRFVYANGTTRVRPTTDLTGVSPSQLTNVTDVVLAGANVTSDEIRVPANSGIGTTLSDVEPGASVWLVVRATTGESRVRTWAQFSCRPETALVRADLAIGGDGTIALATECRSAA